jgi:hypothetical protein
MKSLVDFKMISGENITIFVEILASKVLNQGGEGGSCISFLIIFWLAWLK